jgi:hypothetical protein
MQPGGIGILAVMALLENARLIAVFTPLSVSRGGETATPLHSPLLLGFLHFETATLFSGVAL